MYKMIRDYQGVWFIITCWISKAYFAFVKTTTTKTVLTFAILIVATQCKIVQTKSGKCTDKEKFE